MSDSDDNNNMNKPDFKELDLPPFPPSPATNSRTPFAKRPLLPSSSPHSGELKSSPTTTTTRSAVPAGRGHRRSSSAGAPLIYSGISSFFHSTSANTTTSSTSTSTTSSTTSGGGGGGGGAAAAGGGNAAGGGSSVSSPPTTNLYPSGNICPSGKILKSNMGSSRNSTRTEKLGLGTGNYGHGSIIKGGQSDITSGNSLLLSSDQEQVKKAGNELYRKGNYVEALSMYDRAISISPENATCRSNRAAALTKLGRFGDAVRECEEAVRLDPAFARAHHRLASLYLRLGQVENARQHLLHSQQMDTTELQKLLSLDKHINRCSDARKIGDWKGALRECDAAMLAGAVSSPHIIACKAEAYLKLHQLEDADCNLSDIPKLEPYPASCSQLKFSGMLSEAYVLYIRAQVDMALGRFDSAAAAAEKAGLIDHNNIEIAMLLNNIKLVAKARARGKEFFDSGRFSEACSAYGEGLKYNLSNAVLYCNRAVCWSKLSLWEKSVEDCNQAIKIQPNYTKALLRRAASNAKLERWSEAVRDYEVLRKELPGDNEVAELLSHAQDAMKRS